MSAPKQYNENELLSEVVKGNEKAFRLLFDLYWERIHSVALILTKKQALAEEMVQDVFLKIWLKRDQLAEVDHFGGYLFTIAKNHIYNQLRKKSLEQPFTDGLEQHFLETTALPTHLLEVKETIQLIEDVVAQLPPQQRSVYELSRHEGLDYHTISDRLGISRSTVKNHMTKALQAIRVHLENNKGEWVLVAALLRLLQ